MATLKLYPILFENKVLSATKPEDSFAALKASSKQTTSFAPPNFALIDSGDNVLVLYNVPEMINLLRLGVDTVAVQKVIAGYIRLEESGNNCLGALQVSLVAGSPDYPGAGITMYKLASNHFGAPLTSDRSHSTSIAGRETWAKIETSGEWKKAGTGLDNYAETPKGKKWYRFSGHYPDRMGFFATVDGSDETKPKTPQTVDDCELPNKEGDIDDPNAMAELVGTSDAWKYSGPLKAAALISNHSQFSAWVNEDPTRNPKKLKLTPILQALGMLLFRSRYKGTKTLR